MKLYEIAQNYRNLENLGEVEGLTPSLIKNALESVLDSFNDKIENICKLIQETEGDIATIDNEIERLMVIKKQKENFIKSLKAYVSTEMQGLNKEKIEGKLFKVGFRKSSSIKILDSNVVPREFIKIKQIENIDKLGIKKAIKEGQIVEGVEVVESKNLSIR